MKSETITMSDKELERAKVLNLVSEGILSQEDAGKRLGITSKQVRRLLKGIEERGAIALVSKKRGKPSNRSYSEELKQRVLDLIKCNYRDFKPLLASEVLFERHSIKISSETVRRWMIEAKLWSPRNKKPFVYHPRRERREKYGELIQIDGSYHDWLEGRSLESKQCLIVFIDDATSRIMKMKFYPHESLLAYYETFGAYVEEFGLPMELYSDKLSVFNINAKTAADDALTQFENAMKKIGVALTKANSPQAKGRVERCNRTLQDRLIKWLRLEGVKTYEEANKCLDKYRDIHNERFAVIATDSQSNAHCYVVNMDDIYKHLVKVSTRVLSKGLTISYGKISFDIKLKNRERRLHGKTVTILDDLKGTIKLKIDGNEVLYETHNVHLKEFDRNQNKKITKPKDLIKAKYHPPANHPWRHNYSQNRSQHNI